MKKFLSFFVLCLALAAVSLPVCSLAHAEEESGGGKAEGKKEEGDKKGKGAGDISGGRFAGDPIYVHLAPIVLPVISDSGVEQLVTLLIDIEVTDTDVADNLHINMPKVMDSIMRGLYGGLGQGSLRAGKLVDVAKVKNKALAALRTTFKDGIKDVLVQGVAQRML